ncbi:hypothetical protein EYR38_007428 [Pleurotus pulmonarius]|nr:hypothetical protein EYR38_007428 [Pleurotus pulmonarius]
MCPCLGCIFYAGHLHPPSPSTLILLPRSHSRLTAFPTPAQRKLRRNRISTRVGDGATKADQWQRRKRCDKRRTRVPASFAAAIWRWVFWNAGGARMGVCERGCSVSTGVVGFVRVRNHAANTGLPTGTRIRRARARVVSPPPFHQFASPRLDIGVRRELFVSGRVVACSFVRLQSVTPKFVAMRLRTQRAEGSGRYTHLDAALEDYKRPPIAFFSSSSFGSSLLVSPHPRLQSPAPAVYIVHAVPGDAPAYAAYYSAPASSLARSTVYGFLGSPQASGTTSEAAPRKYPHFGASIAELTSVFGSLRYIGL